MVRVTEKNSTNYEYDLQKYLEWPISAFREYENFLQFTQLRKIYEATNLKKVKIQLYADSNTPSVMKYAWEYSDEGK